MVKSCQALIIALATAVAVTAAAQAGACSVQYVCTLSGAGQQSTCRVVFD
jgi:hypothetical protein